MSATLEQPPTQAPAHDPRCARCGAALASDQEWCLECGAARTLIHRAPDWRIPVAVVGMVVVVAAVAFVIALVHLSSVANNTAGATGTKAARPASATTTPARATTKPIAGWPDSSSGWTVVVAERRTEAAASAAATRIAATGIPVGLLDSSRHAGMQPGRWIVFSGRYATRAAARNEALALRTTGHPTARALLVGGPRS